MISLSLPPVARQCLIVIAANLSGLGAGLCIGWSSPVLVKLEDRNTTVLSRPLSAEEGTWLASVSQLVCVIFLLTGSPITDRIGRKRTFSLIYLPKLIACVIFIFATQFWELMVARVCDGVSLAFYHVVLSTYTAEIADKNIRGSLGSIIQMFKSAGIVGSLCIAPFLSYSTLHLTYLAVTVISALPIVILPETPYFLYSKGKIEESEKVLNSLRSTKQEVQEELQMFIANKNKEEINIRQLLKSKVFRKALTISLVLSGVLPFTGFNFVVFYLQNVMESAGTNIKPEVASLIVGMAQMLACFPPLYLADRFGRKPILVVNVILVGFGMSGLGVFFWYKGAGYEINSFLNILPTLSASIVHLGIASYASALFILVPELFLGPQRAFGVSMSCLAFSIGIFTVAKSYSVLLTYLGFLGSFWLFSAVSVLLLVFILFCVPETKGKMFDEIQEALGGKGIKKSYESQ